MVIQQFTLRLIPWEKVNFVLLESQSFPRHEILRKQNQQFPWQPVIIMFIVLLVDGTFAASSDWVRYLFESSIYYLILTYFASIKFCDFRNLGKIMKFKTYKM